MKKTTTYIVMALLCLFFKVNAQDTKAIDITAKGIHIGQHLPDITITDIHNYKTSTAKISGFRGKLLILDFWATWCSPCVAMIPKMDSLQIEFGNRIQFLSVTYQTEKEVLPFLEKYEKQKGKHYDLPLVAEDKEFHRLFPHVYLPHYVWIDTNGIVRAITKASYVNSKYINRMLNTGSIDAKEKVDIPITYDRNNPLFLHDNKNIRNILKQSTFSGYMEGIGMGYFKTEHREDDAVFERITATNSTIRELFHYAYNKEYKQIIIEVKDTSRFFFKPNISTDYLAWRRNGNAYCYELLNNKRSKLNSSLIMQEELNSFFQEFVATIESRRTKCLALVRTSNVSKIPNAGGESRARFSGFEGRITNCPLTVFIARMQFYLQNHPLPLIDETGYKEWVDLEIKGNLNNVAEINVALARYNLKFIEKDSYIEMLILRDRKLTL